MTDVGAAEHPTHIDEDLERQMETVLASYSRRLQEARDADDRNRELSATNATLLARVDEQNRALKAQELELLESRRREAVALEHVGVLKGIMHAHGASIADVVSRIAIPFDQAKPNGARAEQAGTGRAGGTGLGAVGEALQVQPAPQA